MRKYHVILMSVLLAVLCGTADISAAGVVKKARFQIDTPVVGVRPDYSVEVVGNDSLIVSGVKWSGKFDSKGCFMAKEKYGISFTISVRNGVDAMFPPKYAQTRFYLNDSYMSAGMILGEGRQINTGTSFTIALPGHVVDVTKVFTQQQADAQNPACYVKEHGGDLIIDEAMIAKHNLLKSRNFPIDKILFMEDMKYSAATRILIDYPADKNCVVPSGVSMFTHPNAKEFWLSPEMDLVTFLNEFKTAKGNKEPLYAYSSEAAASGNFTLYISDKVFPNGLMDLVKNGHSLSPQLLKFRTLLYSGDVYEAFEKAGRGEPVGKEWCPGHKFTAKLMTSDRTVCNRSCLKTTWYYYSCEYCGKCEYNENHLFATDVYGATKTDLNGAKDHTWAKIIAPSHYVGDNAEGDPVFVNTCLVCGNDFRQVERCDAYVTPQRYKYLTAASDELSYEQYAEQCRKTWDKYRVAHMLKATVDKPTPNSFAVKAEKMITAKIDDWAMNDVQYASQNDMVDATLMGDDYTRTVTRRQFCSVAVRLAEKLSEGELPAAPAGAFKDTDDIYVRKAFAAGLVERASDGRFCPDAALTREEMATYTYRSLMYARDHSNVRFTPYESCLDTFGDAGRLSAWAVEPMTFMTALGLIEGKNGNIEPDGVCSIQEALQLAYRSFKAEDIGWYQCYKGKGRNPIYRNDESLTQSSYSQGDRVWVFSKDENGWLWVIDPNNGLVRQVPVGDFRPIKVLKDGDAELYYEYVPKDRPASSR